MNSQCVDTKRRSEFVSSFELVPRCDEVLVPALFADGPPEAVSIAIESTRSVFDLVVELSQRLDPADNYSFRSLERPEPFEVVMIGAKDNMCTKEAVPKVLESTYDS